MCYLHTRMVIRREGLSDMEARFLRVRERAEVMK